MSNGACAYTLLLFCLSVIAMRGAANGRLFSLFSFCFAGVFPPCFSCNIDAQLQSATFVLTKRYTALRNPLHDGDSASFLWCQRRSWRSGEEEEEDHRGGGVAELGGRDRGGERLSQPPSFSLPLAHAPTEHRRTSQLLFFTSPAPSAFSLTFTSVSRHFLSFFFVSLRCTTPLHLHSLRAFPPPVTAQTVQTQFFLSRRGAT
jgi:hypothetical protein